MEDIPTRLSCLSIIVDDVDDKKNQPKNEARISRIEQDKNKSETTLQNVQNPYPKQVLDDAIRDILEEAELRKFEFRKLLDEHDALVKNLKKMENEHSDRSNFINNVPKSPILA